MYLIGRTQSTKINNEFNDTREVEYGVPFISYKNGLPNYTQHNIVNKEKMLNINRS